MSTEYRVILQKRDLDGDGKWHNVDTSEPFGKFTMEDYNGLAIDVVLEGYNDRIRRDLTSRWP